MNGSLVKDWMKAKGMRPADLASRLGVSVCTISRILSGRYKTSKPLQIALAHVMGVDESALVGAKQNKAG
jgi:transcriptional regulator with XRE-family HTH domain